MAADVFPAQQKREANETTTAAGFPVFLSVNEELIIAKSFLTSKPNFYCIFALFKIEVNDEKNSDQVAHQKLSRRKTLPIGKNKVPR